MMQSVIIVLFIALILPSFALAQEVTMDNLSTGMIAVLSQILVLQKQLIEGLQKQIADLNARIKVYESIYAVTQVPPATNIPATTCKGYGKTYNEGAVLKWNCEADTGYCSAPTFLTCTGGQWFNSNNASGDGCANQLNSNANACKPKSVVLPAQGTPIPNEWCYQAIGVNGTGKWQLGPCYGVL